MSFKTGGLKAKYKPLINQYEPNREYTVYAALESCSDIWCVGARDINGRFTDLSFGPEDDCAKGASSIIDVMYYLKHNGPGTYKFGGGDDIVIEEMTNDEMRDVFESGRYCENERVRDELTPFTAKWLQDNIDRNSILYRTDVQIMISDVISDERGDAGCIDIIYNGMFWCISKGLASKEWLCTCSNEFRNDCWIPNVRSIADFKRLWRVATGFVLPLKDEK